MLCFKSLLFCCGFVNSAVEFVYLFKMTVLCYSASVTIRALRPLFCRKTFFNIAFFNISSDEQLSVRFSRRRFEIPVKVFQSFPPVSTAGIQIGNRLVFMKRFKRAVPEYAVCEIICGRIDIKPFYKVVCQRQEFLSV